MAKGKVVKASSIKSESQYKKLVSSGAQIVFDSPYPSSSKRTKTTKRKGR